MNSWRFAALAAVTLAMVGTPAYADESDQMFEGYHAAGGVLGYASSGLEVGGKRTLASGLGLAAVGELYRVFGPAAAFGEVTVADAIGLTENEGDNVFSVFVRGHAGFGIPDSTGGATLGVGLMYDTLPQEVGVYGSWMLFDKGGNNTKIRELWGGYFPSDSGGIGMGGQWDYVRDGTRFALTMRLTGANKAVDPRSGGTLLLGFYGGRGGVSGT